MDVDEDFVDIATSFIENGVEFVVVGDYALAAHGFPLTTGDIDLFVRPTLDNAASCSRAMTRLDRRLLEVWCTRRDLNPHALRRRNLKARQQSQPALSPPDRDAATDEQQRAAVSAGQSGGNHDPIESALADALTKATAAGEWSTVRALVGELEARRSARAGVVDLQQERARRGRGKP